MCSAVIHKLYSEFFITSFNSWLKIYYFYEEVILEIFFSMTLS